jgi:hypothetical protein
MEYIMFSTFTVMFKGIEYRALIDDIDSDILSMRWRARIDINKDSETAYVVHSFKEGDKIKALLMHRVIMTRVIGCPLERHEQVDHWNLNGLDNRRENLRIATQSQNNANKGLLSNNTSGFKGVYKKGRRFAAIIWSNKKEIWLGSYLTPEEAHAAYCKAAREYFGEFARFE